MNIAQVSSSAVASDPSTVSAAATRATKKSLDSSDFMKLLAVQFQQQDPMKPMEDTAFIAQMAQFSALQQSKEMASAISRLQSDQQLIMGNAYLGKTVTFAETDAADVTGTVTSMDNTTAGVMLNIGTRSYALSAVKRIEVSAAQPTP
jgi:flagellar basal-body rod modification protein FlgD